LSLAQQLGFDSLTGSDIIGAFSRYETNESDYAMQSEIQNNRFKKNGNTYFFLNKNVVLTFLIKFPKVVD